ncbi:2-dehydro-3-deoxygluconokinase [Candidatus Caldarchaeum subterraneum]|uniref:2-dehydro-3-deoxygluconokinase n=1 Tax=Caldiarchaeum subterraneum TaxID=311458 RepID=E6N5Q7_CALS0|nr:2-dehydro-3-deoxygluconokinase [Candidatus Caldarchaeum subterraneum]BAJ50423.1 2-dehydro-3-deoxygluconokinase [Candidatus Caldarchaeum subterraneum]
MSPTVVTLGESLIQLNAVTRGPLRHVTLFERHVAGAETTVAVCVRRQGLDSGLITRVGDDEFGKCIINWVRGEGVDISHVKIDPEAPTGIYFVQRGFPIPARSKMFYYRTGSAGSRLSPEDIDPDYIGSAKVFHVTGITPALSETAKNATYKALEAAVSNDVTISFDTNIRPVLWKTNERAVKTLMPIIEKTNILFTDPTDASILLGTMDQDTIIKTFLNMGVDIVVLKMGERGALAADRNNRAFAAPLPVYVEDPIGAGDAFAGTFITSILKGRSLNKSLQRATIAGTLVVTVRGDEEALPTEEDIDTNIKHINIHPKE